MRCSAQVVPRLLLVVLLFVAVACGRDQVEIRVTNTGNAPIRALVLRLGPSEERIGELAVGAEATVRLPGAPAQTLELRWQDGSGRARRATQDLGPLLRDGGRGARVQVAAGNALFRRLDP